MAQTLYASFPDAQLAEKAAGALLDYGVREEDISLVSKGERGTGYQNTTARAGSDADNYAYSDAAVTPVSAVGGEQVSQDLYDTDPGLQSESAATTASNPYALHSGGAYAASLSPGLSAQNSGALLGDPGDLSGSPERMVYAADSPMRGAGEPLATGTTMRSDMDPMDSDDESVNRNPGRAAALENIAKHGITTTTAADAESGAVKGAGIGLVLGALAAFVVPGVGWALGGGALAAALGATALATGAGAIAGGVTGYLKDQGVPAEAAENYHGNVEGGGALLELHMNSPKMTQQLAEEIIAKYHGSDVHAY